MDVDVDDFQPLTEDIVTIIFSKLVPNYVATVSDIQFLFRCLLISKKYKKIICNAISTFQTLSLNINTDPIFPSLRGRKKKIISKIIRRFHNLRSLYVEFNNELEYGIKWKAVYKPGVYCFAALRLLKESQSKSKLKSKSKSNLHTNKITAMTKFHELMILISCRHKFLNSIVVSNSNREGRICYGKKLIDEMRNSRCYNSEAFKKAPLYLHRGVVPELCVPLFGALPSKVEVYVVKSGLHYSDYMRDIINWEFDDKEKEFGEALTMIMRDHMDKIRLLA